MVTKDIKAFPVFDSIAGRNTSVFERMRKKFSGLSGSGVFGTLNLKTGPDGVRMDSPRNPDDLICVATTDTVDLDKEVVIPTGVDPTYFAKNGAVYVDHVYESEYTVGKLRVSSPFPSADNIKGWRTRVRLIRGTKHEPQMRALANGGVLGCSIGFIATDVGSPSAEEKTKYPEARSIVRKWKWLELSLTSMPCNVDCRVYLDGVVEPEAAKSKRVIVVV